MANQNWAQKFDGLECDSDGQITISELKQSLSDKYGTTLSDSDLADMFCDLDTNEDQKITKDEFVAAMCKKDRKKAFGEFFDKYDTDNNGNLSKEEVIKICNDVGIPYDESQTIMDACDTDSDGKIKKNEFMKNM